MSNYSSSQFNEDDNTPWYKVLNFIPPKSTVLDIGCSSGNFGYELIQRKQCVVDGVEIDPGDVKLARKKLREVYTFNVEHEVPKNLEGSYDVVYFGDVIEHLVDPVTSLRNTKKLLKKGGMVVFSVPNMAHMSVRMMLLAGDFEYGKTGLLDNTHLHFYTRRSIEQVLNEAGYNLEQLDWVKRDMPKAILDEKLAGIGLQARKQFYDMSKTVEAAGYQFIGVAKPSAKVPEVLRQETSPAINELEQHIDRMNREHREEVDRIKAHYDNLLKEQAVQHKHEIDVREERIAASIPAPKVIKRVGKKILGRKG